MKRMLSFVLTLVMLLSFAACDPEMPFEREVPVTETFKDAVHIELSDDMTEAPEGVTLSHDIVYYEAGHDFTYGEGTEADAHTPEEAEAHLVVTITKPGDYLLTGSLSAGQIAVDLGENAKDAPNAVVTLILGGVDITCTVAPAVIFYNVYECGDADNPTKDVDTSAAGANVIIADYTSNRVSGSYVARIYKSVELSEDGTEVIDSKKLHKYDGAFYSKMSMNIDGEDSGTGELYIYAENEGLDSEMHLTVNGGNIYIYSGNDGINTNEDGVSVTTINGGTVDIHVNGSTGEGDGIDSNGWLVINGGLVIAAACESSEDSGIDADMGIHLNGGTVRATGNMMDAIAESEATYVVFRFAEQQKKLEAVFLDNAEGDWVAFADPSGDYRYLLLSAPELTAGEYTLLQNRKQLSGCVDGGMGMGGGPGQGGIEIPKSFDPSQIQRPEGMEPPEGMGRPETMQPPAGAENMMPPGGVFPQGAEGGRGEMQPNMELSEVFVITEGGNRFYVDNRSVK